MTDRIPLDHLNSDQLDALYDERDRLGYEVQQWKSTYGEHALRDTLARLHSAEGAVDRVRKLLVDDPSGIFSDDEIRAALDEPKEG